MSFSVNLVALRGLPPFLDRRGREIATAADYTKANTNLVYGPGLANIAGRHEVNVQRVVRFLTVASTAYADMDAERLRQVTIDYAKADQRAAARADAALPEVPGGDTSGTLSAAERALGPDVFTDRVTPISALADPADHHGDLPYQPSWFDLLSPTSVARDAVWKVTAMAARLGILDRAYDPFEYIVCPLVGDWAGLLRCAEVFDHVADFVRDQAAELNSASTVVAEIWTGHAAALCRANLGDFSVTIGSAESPLRIAANAYRAVANGVHDNADLLSAIVTELADYAIESAINFEAWGIFSAYELSSGVSNCIRMLRAALRIVAKVQDIVSAGMNLSDEAMHDLGVLTTVVRMPVLAAPTPRIPAVR